MKNHTLITTAICAAIILTGSSTFAQATPQTTTDQALAKKAPKKTKVWTDDNIDSLRSPADVYRMQQEQEDEQQETVKPSQAKQAGTGTQSSAQQGMYPVPVVKTPQQADQIIASDQQDIKEQQDSIKQTEQELATAPDSYKARLNWRINSRKAAVARLQTQIADLQKQKDALQTKTPAANGAAPSSSASTQN